MLGADLELDLRELGTRVTMGVWPRYTHVFIEDGLDVNLLEADVPFFFRVPTPVVTPYAAPGLALSFSGGTTLKLNLIGGCKFSVTEHLEPYTQLSIRMIQGTYVDLIGGVLFRL